MRTNLVCGVLFVVFMGPPRSGHSVVAGPAEGGHYVQQPTFRTEANYVRVDVFATIDGKPVTDLRQEDFEVLEDRVPQTITAFEHVRIRGSVAQEQRREPNTVAASRAMLDNPRARIFVIFLDFYHVGLDGSYGIRRPLAEALDRMIGEEDLVAIMTPEMSALDLSFARRTTTLDGLLSRHWIWGERERVMPTDPEDEKYRACYARHPDIADEMIARRREVRTLDALQDLVRFLHGAREERKAVLAVTNGWVQYQPSRRLARQLDDTVPGTPETGVDPRTGRPITGATRDPKLFTQYVCDGDRINLAQIDHERKLRDIIDEANRANASFYPIDPRGLVAFDTSIGPAPPPPPAVDRANLNARIESLRTLAAGTDGAAIVATSNIAAGLRRIADDLSSYYLLGYYSTGRLDGRFHSIAVRIKRPGVSVRARRGYLAARETEVAATAAESVSAAPDAFAGAIAAAVGALTAASRELPVRLRAVAGWTPGGSPAIWAVGEVGAGDWLGGAEVDLMLADAAGSTVSTARTEMAPGARSFKAAVSAPSLAPGEYSVRARLRGRRPDAPPVTASAPLVVAAKPSASGAILIRRGPTSGQRDAPTADPRFRRGEVLRVEVPSAANGEPTAVRLLDRTGQPLQVPVAGGVREDADGSRWMTAQVTLAPLAAGDYVIEVARRAAATGGSGASGASGEQPILIAFRVVP